jgi:hypothetical protein
MQETLSSGSTRRKTSGQDRALPAAKRLNVGKLHAGEIRVVGQLIRKRYEKSVVEIASRAGVGEETLREYLLFKHPEAWTTNNLTALALGLYPDDLKELTRRWMRKFRRREKAARVKEAGWKFAYP